MTAPVDVAVVRNYARISPSPNNTSATPSTEQAKTEPAPDNHRREANTYHGEGAVTASSMAQGQADVLSILHPHPRIGREDTTPTGANFVSKLIIVSLIIEHLH